MKEIVEFNQARPIRTHSVTVENRERIIVTAVNDVSSFNDTEVEGDSDGGHFTVFGQNLHISKLNLEDGQLIVDGFVEGFEYAESPAAKGSFLSRLFK